MAKNLTGERILMFLFISGALLSAFRPMIMPEWGFYAHRKINYYAVMTIPPPLNQFYKPYAEYLREHAVDPDRRRYAVEGEGIRHFIDLDRWYRSDTLALTRNYTEDRILFGKWEWRKEEKLFPVRQISRSGGRICFQGPVSLDIDSFGLAQEVSRIPSEKSGTIPRFLYPEAEPGQLIYTDTFSIHGNLPYNFELNYARLTQAMKEGDVSAIVKWSNDIGHYVADAHVPLHTTENYNGQLSDQLGIHAFWESRIPELFEEEYFTAWVGRAEYIGEPQDFIWSVIRNSHALVPEVLAKEREARKKVKESRHFCYEERGNQIVRTQCPELAREYMKLMDGMVEDQWKKAIKAVGSVWFSAWKDAGEPELWLQHVILPIDTVPSDSVKYLLPEDESHGQPGFR